MPLSNRILAHFPEEELNMDAQLEKVAEWLGRAERCLVFTGAGVSTESGIPDFRSPGGVWSRTKPILFEEYRRDGLAQLEYWRQRTETHLQFADAQPNTAHRVFALGGRRPHSRRHHAEYRRLAPDCREP